MHTTPATIRRKQIARLRLAAIASLMLASFIFIFYYETDKSYTALALHILLDKTIGLALIYTAAQLYNRWSKTDTYLRAYDQSCDRNLTDN